MLMRTMLFAGVAAVVASQVPSWLGDLQLADLRPALVDNTTTAALGTSERFAHANGAIRIPADAQGHFTGSFKINGKPMDGMIDTGATYVALNVSLAQRLGYSPSGLDFRYSVNTANGKTKAARVTLDNVQIGSVSVKDVDALVLKDEALSSILIGMSFLNKLRSYSVSDGALSLTQ